MSDIVERLRKLTASGRTKHLSKADRLEAADTITALRAENERLRLALEGLLEGNEPPSPGSNAWNSRRIPSHEACSAARAALRDKP